MALAAKRALDLKHLAAVAEEVDHIQRVILRLQSWDRLKLLWSESGGLVVLPLRLILQTEPLAVLAEILLLALGFKSRAAVALGLQQPQVDLLGQVQIRAPCFKAATDQQAAQGQEHLLVAQM